MWVLENAASREAARVVYCTGVGTGERPAGKQPGWYTVQVWVLENGQQGSSQGGILEQVCTGERRPGKQPGWYTVQVWVLENGDQASSQGGILYRCGYWRTASREAARVVYCTGVGTENGDQASTQGWYTVQVWVLENGQQGSSQGGILYRCGYWRTVTRQAPRVVYCTGVGTGER